MTMKTKLSVIAVVGAAGFTSGAIAQTVVATPSPAPSVSATSPALVPGQTIFSNRLPTPPELTNAAAAQGVTIDRIEQTNAQVVVAYKFADGQTKVVAYQLLPVAGSVTAATSPSVIVQPAPTTVPSTLYYEPAPRVVYYDPFYYPYSYGSGWYPPVSLSLGLGFGFHGGGGFRGGFHGGRR